MKILAYAKINLTLDITGRREDSYHLLDMVMQSVTLADEIELVRGPSGSGIQMECSREELPCGPDNTGFRAAESFFREAGIADPGLCLRLKKKIPFQAGLGGGSADAAAVLLGLNQLYGVGFSEEKLREIGLKVGADVPFCLTGGTARVQGIGEKITRLPDLPRWPVVICKPSVSVSTKEAYRKSDQAPGEYPFSTPRMLAAVQDGSLSAVCGAVGNQFEEILRIPEIIRLKEQMRHLGACGVCMTGSGSAVYGIFEREEPAEICETSLKQEYPETFLCSTCRKPAFLFSATE